MTSDTQRIATWLQPVDILLDADVHDRQHSFELIAHAIGRTQAVDAGPVTRALARREQAGSTALGDGFALPHARVAGIVQPLTVFMRVKSAIAFDAPDHKPVANPLAILAPLDGSRTDHLELLALVAKLFSDRVFRARLDDALQVDAAAAAFRDGIARAVDRTDD